MKLILAAVTLCALVVPLVHAETVWRWTDDTGSLHYSNQRAFAPASAVTVTAQLAHSRLPADDSDVTAYRRSRANESDTAPRRAPSEAQAVGKRLHRIYDEERMRFGCFSGDVMLFGGWAHGDDVSTSIGCYRYLLGPDAWLNTARAELAVRANGISPRELYRMYRASRGH